VKYFAVTFNFQTLNSTGKKETNILITG